MMPKTATKLPLFTGTNGRPTGNDGSGYTGRNTSSPSRREETRPSPENDPGDDPSDGSDNGSNNNRDRHRSRSANRRHRNHRSRTHSSERSRDEAEKTTDTLNHKRSDIYTLICRTTGDMVSKMIRSMAHRNSVNSNSAVNSSGLI